MKNIPRTIINEITIEEAMDFAHKQRFSTHFISHCFRPYQDETVGFGLINYEGSRFEIVQWGTTVIEGDVVCPMKVQEKCIR